MARASTSSPRGTPSRPSRRVEIVLPPRPLRLREEELRAQGYTVIGVDEAGRGPLAGPVVAGAVALDERFETERFAALHDSKQVSEEAREKLFEQLTQEFAWGVGEADAAEIDAINIRQASWLAMRRAVENLQARFGQTSTCPTPDASTCSPFILLDGLGYGPGPWPYEALVKGDAREACIAAASIVAKVWRDRLMRVAHERFPQYGFAQHKGYPSPAHLEALRLRGPCELHRRSFGPVRRAVQAAASEAPASKLSEPSR